MASKTTDFIRSLATLTQGWAVVGSLLFFRQAKKEYAEAAHAAAEEKRKREAALQVQGFRVTHRKHGLISVIDKPRAREALKE